MMTNRVLFFFLIEAWYYLFQFTLTFLDTRLLWQTLCCMKSHCSGQDRSIAHHACFRHVRLVRHVRQFSFLYYSNISCCICISIYTTLSGYGWLISSNWSIIIEAGECLASVVMMMRPIRGRCWGSLTNQRTVLVPIYDQSRITVEVVAIQFSWSGNFICH